MPWQKGGCLPVVLPVGHWAAVLVEAGRWKNARVLKVTRSRVIWFGRGSARRAGTARPQRDGPVSPGLGCAQPLKLLKTVAWAWGHAAGQTPHKVRTQPSIRPKHDQPHESCDSASDDSAPGAGQVAVRVKGRPRKYPYPEYPSIQQVTEKWEKWEK
uniref:Uncharacterized protein n=1 Tax=Eutreptiella gymnastica TaxID=73025 RepID=A0A7S4GFH5_9EUGL